MIIISVLSILDFAFRERDCLDYNRVFVGHESTNTEIFGIQETLVTCYRLMSNIITTNKEKKKNNKFVFKGTLILIFVVIFCPHGYAFLEGIFANSYEKCVWCSGALHIH